MEVATIIFLKRETIQQMYHPINLLNIKIKLYASHLCVKLMDWINREIYHVVEQDGLSDQGIILTSSPKKKKSPCRIPCSAFIYLKATSDTNQL